MKNAAVKRSRSRQKVSESSQNPLSSSRRCERARQGRSNVQRSSNDDPRRGIPTQFCPGHQIIKPLCLHAEIFLHGPIRLCEQSPKFVRLDIEMGSVTSYTICSSTPLALGERKASKLTLVSLLHTSLCS